MAETIDNTLVRLQTIIKNNYTMADISPGTVLNELILKLNATLQNPIKNDILTLNQGNTISAASTSEVDTYDPIMDGVASNYNVNRSQGYKSVGKLKIVVSDSRGRYLAAGSIFNQPVLRLNYLTTADYTVVVEPDGTDPSELPLFTENGLYYFILPVVAADVGQQYQVSDQTKFLVDSANTIGGFVDAYAYGNFISGANLESDKELISRFQQGIANKSLLTTKSINFRLSELYPALRDVSVIGANEFEMTRSKANLFGISTLGMADVYVRTSLGPETVKLVKTATRPNEAAPWTITFDKNDIPGFYRIVSILPANQEFTGKLVDTPVFSFTTEGVVPTNTVTNAMEGRFTSYQTCTTTFNYDVSAVLEYDFEVVLSYQPYIGEIQDIFLNSDERIACADYLIKAVIPCYVTVALTVHRRNSSVELPVDKIKADIFNYINSIKFGDRLYASKLVEICHNYDVLYVDLPVSLTGDIYTPSGTILTIKDNDFLTIPVDRVLGVTPRTTAFFTDYFKSSELRTTMTDSIGITVV